MALRATIFRTIRLIVSALLAAVNRLDKSFSPSVTLRRLGSHRWVPSDAVYIFHVLSACFWFYLMQAPPFPYKLAIPFLWGIGLLIPFTSQFFLPATPVFSWLLTFYSSRFIPSEWRPTISVVFLPTLESVLYGANISDILTRFTHPLLDILAWLPYGLIHFVFPFVIAVFLWLFRLPAALRLWGRVIGYMNLIGVLVQIALPCAAPWYELIYGLTPADYSVRGHPGGLGRIDQLFHSDGYARAFGSSPVVFGAFPSLHAGWATIEALFITHFWPYPGITRAAWAYTFILYWATMYLTHHYLIDVVSGACLAVISFYLGGCWREGEEGRLVAEVWSGPGVTARPKGCPGAGTSRTNGTGGPGRGGRSKYEVYDLEASGRRRGPMLDEEDFDLESEASEEEDITFRSPNPASASFPSSSENGSASQPNGHVGGNGSARGHGRARSHRHTASIASLIRPDERGVDVNRES